MSTRFQLLMPEVSAPHAEVSGADAEASVDVVLDDTGLPVAVRDLSGLRPAVLVSADADLATVLASADLVEALADDAVRLVVLRDGDVVGVLSTAVVQAAAGALLERGGPQLGSDAEPFGQPTTQVGKIRLVCATCLQPNDFESYSQVEAYRCQRGDHAFVRHTPATRRPR
jgi:hypothetical protein